MSENTKNIVTEAPEVKNTKETNTKDNGWLKNFIWVMVGVIIGIALGYAVFYASLGSVATNTNIINEESTEESTEDVAVSGDTLDSISTYEFEHIVLDGEDKEKAVKKITDCIDYISTHDTYLQVQVGENEYESYLYNTAGECFAQASDGSYNAVFRDDKNVIKYSSDSSAIAFGKDIEILGILRNAATATLDNSIDGIQLFEMVPVEDDSNVVEYRVDLVGEEAVKACYTSYGDDFAEIMFDNLMEQVPDWEPHLVMVYIIEDIDSETANISSYCLYVEDNQEYTNWLLQGYFEVGHWELDEKWYDTDFSTIDSQIYDELMTDLTSDITAVLDAYIAENEVDIIEVEDELTGRIEDALGLEVESTEVESTETE